MFVVLNDVNDMANLTNAERLAQIKAVLPLGAQTEIAASIGTSRAAVCQVLSGYRKSPRIADGIFKWFLEWSTKRPKVNQVDKALAGLEAQAYTK